MPKSISTSETPTIFLAMFWGGGGPYSIPQIIHVYDWINRATPTKADMETALNTLLSLKFIIQEEDTFSVDRKIGKAFDEYRKKRKKRKFVAIREFFEKYEPLGKVKKTIKLSEKEYKKYLKNYMDSF